MQEKTISGFEIITCVLLFAAGMLLAFFLVMTQAGIEGFSSAFAVMLLDAFSWLAYAVPVYLMVAGLLVFVSYERIIPALFLYIGSLLPFSCLVFMLNFWNHAEYWFNRFPFLRELRVSGVLFLGSGLTAITTALIFLARDKLLKLDYTTRASSNDALAQPTGETSASQYEQFQNADGNLDLSLSESERRDKESERLNPDRLADSKTQSMRETISHNPAGADQPVEIPSVPEDVFIARNGAESLSVLPPPINLKSVATKQLELEDITGEFSVDESEAAVSQENAIAESNKQIEDAQTEKAQDAYSKAYQESADTKVIDIDLDMPDTAQKSAQVIDLLAPPEPVNEILTPTTCIEVPEEAYGLSTQTAEQKTIADSANVIDLINPPEPLADILVDHEAPIPLMFNRTEKADKHGTLPEDPALSLDYWTSDIDEKKNEIVTLHETSRTKSLNDSGIEKHPSNRKKSIPYELPTATLLKSYPDGQYWIVDEKTKHSAAILRDTLKEFNIDAEVTGIRKGPVITMFEILPAPGVRLSKIANLSDNIALRLAASSVRIVAPIPGKHAVGIEVPNEKRSIVSFKEIIESPVFTSAKYELPVALGKDISGDVQVIDLTQTPHLLIAGATGSGKSVCVNALILSILCKKSFEDVKLILIDPKIVELKLYNDIPHLLTPVITEPKKAFQALQYAICEMEKRYSLLDSMGVRDIKAYNKKITEKNIAAQKMPYIVVIIDEFADLMATTGKELESTLARLAAMSRAVGIHLVLATQRPSIDVITGLIKANIPSRIAFMVASKFDSRIIIDSVGAEKLLGKGDMLFSSAWDAVPVRMQGAFVSEAEVEDVVSYVKTLGEPEYIDEEIFIEDEDEEGTATLFDDEDDDPLFEKALQIVLSQGKASASFLQRKLKIGYNRAARLVELMEEKGIVGPAQGSKPRDVMRNPNVIGLERSSTSVPVEADETYNSCDKR